eukprot:366332-Chlamydomonas_euryale.AAC.5
MALPFVPSAVRHAREALLPCTAAAQRSMHALTTVAAAEATAPSIAVDAAACCLLAAASGVIDAWVSCVGFGGPWSAGLGKRLCMRRQARGKGEATYDLHQGNGKLGVRRLHAWLEALYPVSHPGCGFAGLCDHAPMRQCALPTAPSSSHTCDI